MFESGNWRFTEAADSEGEEEEDDADYIERLRAETQKIRDRKEEERLVALNAAAEVAG